MDKYKLCNKPRLIIVTIKMISTILVRGTLTRPNKCIIANRLRVYLNCIFCVTALGRRTESATNLIGIGYSYLLKTIIHDKE